MLPKIETLLSVEIIRDGGSFAIDFDSGGSHWSLFIGIMRDQASETKGYKEPQLINRSLDITHDATWKHAEFYIKNAQKEDHSEVESRALEMISRIVEAEGNYLRPNPFSE